MTLMEAAQLLGNFGEFFGAIAVVATLLYLATQIRHSTRTNQHTAFHEARRDQAAAINLLCTHSELSVPLPAADGSYKASCRKW